jgi:hypothetical protein
MMGLLGGLARPSMAGDSLLFPAPYVNATDAADTVTVEKINAGILQYTAFSAGRNLTTDTAANIIAAFPELNVGESIVIAVSCVAAFAGTWVAGAGVTLAGRATTPASSYSLVVITKTGAATVGWRVL